MDYKGEIFFVSEDQNAVENLCVRLNNRLEKEFAGGAMFNEPFFYVAYSPDNVSGILEPFKSRFAYKCPEYEIGKVEKS